MNISSRVAAVILAAAVVSRAAAQPADLERLRKELLDAEIAVEKARYRIAPCDAEVPGLAELAAKQAKELGITVFAAPPVEGTKPIPNTPLQLRRIEISGRGAFADAHHFLHRIAFERDLRLFDIEALQMTAIDGGNVQFSARIAEACWAAEQSTAPPSVHDIAGMYRQRLQQLQTIDAAVKRIGEYMQPMRFVDWLAALDDAWGDLPVLLSELHYTAPRLTVKGIALGTVARASIERAATAQWSPAGECQSFTATAVLPSRDYEEHGFAVKEIFDPRAASPCRADAPSRTKIAVSHGSGDLTLHARDIDVVSLFRVLNDIRPSDGYVIASAVVGRVDVDAEGATLSEILDALRTAHVAQISDGPLHIVCKSGCIPSQQSFKGEPLSMSLNHAEVADVLNALTAAVAPAKLRIPPGVGGTISIFATELEWDRLFDAIVIASRNASAPPRAPRLFTVRDAGKMSVDDIRLAALAGTAGTWHAYTRSLGDSGLIVPLTTETTLFDGRVESVDGERVVLRTQGGQLIVTLNLANISP